MSTMPLPDPRSATPSRSVKVYFDGGCRPNPGAMEVAAVVRGAAHVLPAIGHGSSFDAEWRALIHAAEVALSLGITDFVLLGDAASVVAQANGSAPCRGAHPLGTEGRAFDHPGHRRDRQA
eukprot:gene55239-75701_t